jgi:hypothetical protein
MHVVASSNGSATEVALSGSGKFLKATLGKHSGHDAFPDGSGDALGRAVADVASCEQARHAGLEGEWISFERPGFRPPSVLKQIGPRENVTPRVGANPARFRPPSARLAADADKQPIRGKALDRPACLDAHRTQMLRVSVQLPHLGAQADIE